MICHVSLKFVMILLFITEISLLNLFKYPICYQQGAKSKNVLIFILSPTVVQLQIQY